MIDYKSLEKGDNVRFKSNGEVRTVTGFVREYKSREIAKVKLSPSPRSRYWMGKHEPREIKDRNADQWIRAEKWDEYREELQEEPSIMAEMDELDEEVVAEAEDLLAE